MTTDSSSQVIRDEKARAPIIAIDTIDVAWQRLHTSEAYWNGYLGMLVGGLVYSILTSLVLAIESYGIGLVILIVWPLSFTALIAIVGGVVFLVIRAMNSSLGWLLTSRYAAATAACLTGLFVLFVPMFAIGNTLGSGAGFNYICFGPMMLIVLLQSGAWLAIEREIRKFEQRVAFKPSQRRLPKKELRFGIGSLLVCTFWLAGMMAIFGAASQLNKPGGGYGQLLVALVVSVFLSLGFTVMIIWMNKTVRILSEKLFGGKLPN